VLLALPVAPSAVEPMTSPLEPWLKAPVGWLVSGAEIAAALVIAIGVARGSASFLRQVASHTDPSPRLRLALGRTLALGLELTLASDILRTAVAPRREDIVTLTAIVLLRTLLNHFLGGETAGAQTG
jgi:uncharacterized membrane protein